MKTVKELIALVKSKPGQLNYSSAGIGSGTPVLPDVPTLVLCGSLDQTTPPALARALATAIPGASYQEISGSGHCPMLEQPDALVAAMDRFLTPKKRTSDTPQGRSSMKIGLRQLLAGTALSAALAVFGPAANGQAVYKFTDRAGRTVYSDDPAAAPGTVKRIEAPPPPIHSPKPAAKLSPGEKKTLEQSQQRSAELNRVNADIVAAESALREAEARRAQGAEPGEGDRQGRRYRPEFWERQQGLQKDIDDARAKLDAAIGRRNELR